MKTALLSAAVQCIANFGRRSELRWSALMSDEIVLSDASKIVMCCMKEPRPPSSITRSPKQLCVPHTATSCAVPSHLLAVEPGRIAKQKNFQSTSVF
jgi:hypothetical protein